MRSSRPLAHLLMVVCLAVFPAACSKTGANAPAESASTSTAPASGAPLPTDSTPSPSAPSTGEAGATTPPPVSAAETPRGPVTALRLADFKSGWSGGEGWIARTDDAGRTWKTQWKQTGTVRQLFALNGREAWATVESGDAGGLKLLHTSDGGKKWQETGTSPNGGFLHFVSSREGFSGNARTTDGGRTWTDSKKPEGTVGEAYFHDRDNGWAVASSNGKFSVQRTTDGGQSWQPALIRVTEAPVTDAVIRSAGKKDAWVVLVGDSGMSQTSYSLFHTSDGGDSWIPVLANNQAGSGPAPGFGMDEKHVPRNNGNGPGAFYVVGPKVAFMGGICSACDRRTADVPGSTCPDNSRDSARS